MILDTLNYFICHNSSRSSGSSTFFGVAVMKSLFDLCAQAQVHLQQRLIKNFYLLYFSKYDIKIDYNQLTFDTKAVGKYLLYSLHKLILSDMTSEVAISPNVKDCYVFNITGTNFLIMSL